VARPPANFIADLKGNREDAFTVAGNAIAAAYLHTTPGRQKSALIAMSEALERASVRYDVAAPHISQRLRGQWDLTDELLRSTDSATTLERVERVRQLFRGETALTTDTGFYRLGMELMAIMMAPDLIERTEALEAIHDPLRRAGGVASPYPKPVQTRLMGMLDVTEPMLHRSENDLTLILQIDALGELEMAILKQVEAMGPSTVPVSELAINLGRPEADVIAAAERLAYGPVSLISYMPDQPNPNHPGYCARRRPYTAAALGLKDWLGRPESHPVA
jgi:hypothetical protein